jgi:hypothetical protein
LKANKIRGRQIRVETNSAQGLLGIIYDDGTNQQVANNGYHEAIVIEVEGVETVFDNIYADGKPLEDWLIDLVVIPGNRLIIITKEEF